MLVLEYSSVKSRDPPAMNATNNPPTEFFHVLNVRKPLEMTSHDVVSVVRKIYGLKKVGHMGTLDPMAEGVLPVSLGKATRLLEYFPSDKRYEVEITLGIETNTLDQEGDITRQAPCVNVTEAKVKTALSQFTGKIEQEIPIFSAKKVNGKKLYELARENKPDSKPIELPFKTVEIFEIKLLNWDETNPEHPKVILEIHCGSGTFMRAIARDLGQSLGCGAYMSALTRTAHGEFFIDDAVDLEQLKTIENPHQFLQSPARYLNLPQLEITPVESDKLKQGMKIMINQRVPEGLKRLHDKELVLLTNQADIVAISKAQPDTNQFKPVKVFN